VGFDSAGNEHEYDLTVNNDIPSRVKTIIPKEQEGIEIYQKINNITLQLMAGKKIDEEEVEEEILNLLRINGRLTYAGFLLNQWASSNNHNVSMIDKAFLNSLPAVQI
jgi:hypothetical protein